jgi:deoxycytidine triphosphate deaminase
MQHRTTIDQVVAVWEGRSAAARGWCVMAPDTPGDPGFEGFLSYLQQRQRAGIVRPLGPEGAVIHTLYLVPASAEVSKRLAIPYEPGRLLVLVPDDASA